MVEAAAVKPTNAAHANRAVTTAGDALLTYLVCCSRSTPIACIIVVSCSLTPLIICVFPDCGDRHAQDRER
jgi:hypothetical protein